MEKKHTENVGYKLVKYTFLQVMPIEITSTTQKHTQTCCFYA